MDLKRFTGPLLFASLLIFQTNAAFAAPEVQCRHLVSELVQYKAPWFEVVVPTAEGFEYHKVERQQEVESLMQGRSPEMIAYMDGLFEKAQEQYKFIVQYLRPVAQRFHAKLEYRLKDAESLKGKIISRARSFHESGNMFSASDLYDLIGTRLIVPLDSHLLLLGSSHDGWAKYLTVKPDVIREVELKGGPEECAAGRCYRATHIALMHESGVQWEIQVMSQTMSYWAKWDHPNVYKRTGVTAEYKDRLKSYSRAWVKMIRALEDKKLFRRQSTQEIEVLLKDLDLDVKVSSRSWIMDFEKGLIEKYGIQSEDQFIQYQSTTALTALRSLFRLN